MKRLVTLLLSLLIVCATLTAAPYPKKTTVLKLDNGHKLTIDLYGPDGWIEYLNHSILVNGLNSLLKDTGISSDLSVISTFADAKGQFSLSVSFDEPNLSTVNGLKPAVADDGAHYLPLLVPERACKVLYAWIFGDDGTIEGPVLKSGAGWDQPVINFTVFYSVQGKMLSIPAFASKDLSFYQINAHIRFKPSIRYSDYQAMVIQDIKLSGTQYADALQAGKFILDPVRPSPKPEGSALIYKFFGIPIPN